MLYYVEAYAVGSVGVNQHMRALTDASFLSWDWEHLLRKPAGKDHYRAFLEIVNRFQPVLQKTQWPNSPEWQFVKRQWPQDRGSNGWFEQYQTLTRRVRAAAKSKLKCPGWWRMVRATVQPVLGCGQLRVCRSTSSWPQFQHVCQARRDCVLFLVREFLGDGPDFLPVAARMFQAAPSSLVAVGFGGRPEKRQRSQQTRKLQCFRGSCGSFASLLSPGSNSKLVRVTALEREVDESRLASSLVSDKSLVFPDGSGDHCWHAVRVYLRARLKAPESVCERWGSLMHMLWDSVGGWQPHRIVSRLFMRESQFLNQPAVEKSIVEEIAAKLYHSSGMNPYVAARYVTDEVSDSEDEESADDVARVLRTSLRENGRSREWWRQKSCPAVLLPSAREAVSQAMNGSNQRGFLAPLPLYGGDAAATPSVRAEKMAKWLNSEEAVSWRLDRKALFPNYQ